MQGLFDAPPERKGLFSRFRRAVSKTRNALSDQIGDLFEGGATIDSDVVEDLEMTLIAADIGVRTANEIIEDVQRRHRREQLQGAAAVNEVIAGHLMEILSRSAAATNGAGPARGPEVILVVGVNGVGKTTTIGKLAQRLRAEGRQVMLCAADTFRAAAADQLAIWGERTGCPVIRQRPGADPGAVVYDALQAASVRGIDTVLVDTAGRLHNKVGLMAELSKICRTAGRLVDGAPHQVLLVIDAVTGQNGLEQARQFATDAGVTGLVLAKLDGTAKGGIVVAIARELGLPIRWVGVGEAAEDLVPFDPESFVRSLFGPRPSS